MANQHTSQDDLLDANNGVDTFPPLTETPAAMSPVPHHTNAQGRTASADEHTHTAGEGDDDESWSTDSEHDDESHANVVQRITGSGADALDSRAIYHAFFGAHSSSGPSRNIGASTAKKATGIPVYKVALGTRDIESCLKLEEACFPKTGADREKVARSSSSELVIHTNQCRF
jgi:ribosomal protein S18 acetylase RimI-like enzyme